jgi:hypothetical protein
MPARARKRSSVLEREARKSPPAQIGDAKAIGVGNSALVREGQSHPEPRTGQSAGLPVSGESGYYQPGRRELLTPRAALRATLLL